MTLRYDFISQFQNFHNISIAHRFIFKSRPLFIFVGVDQQQNRPAFWASFNTKAETGKSGEDQCQKYHRYVDLAFNLSMFTSVLLKGLQSLTFRYVAQKAPRGYRKGGSDPGQQQQGTIKTTYEKIHPILYHENAITKMPYHGGNFQFPIQIEQGTFFSKKALHTAGSSLLLFSSDVSFAFVCVYEGDGLGLGLGLRLGRVEGERERKRHSQEEGAMLSVTKRMKACIYTHRTRARTSTSTRTRTRTRISRDETR
jgi:hypothetical protein